MSTTPDMASLLREALTEIRTLRAAAAKRTAPIAIVGAACRFPGGADDLESFARVLRAGVDAMGPVPSDRWDADLYYDPDPDAPGKMVTREGAFVENIDRFDAEFFGIAPREAEHLDPQQRLLLETAWEAFENAGMAPDGLRGRKGGVFTGLMYGDYVVRALRENGLDAIGAYLGTGGTFSATSGRLAYFFGLQGPAIAVDTACSSSLVSVHLACQSLRSGECEFAIAGGVNALLSPEPGINLSKARMISPRGRCRTFDASADGYARGEGCGVVILKPLASAQADGDLILGVIRGSAVNQDGRSNGLTAPNGPAQQALLRAALEAASVSAHDIGYVECHGTATPLGDPIEVQALLEVLEKGRSPDRPLALGSVKTNFGHLEGAAGICGLLKALLVVRGAEVFPHLHLQALNPRIDLRGLPVVIPTQAAPWFADGSRRLAGVSSFGFVGTNAHVIVEAPPPAASDNAGGQSGPLPSQCVVAVSAKTQAALRELAGRHADWLERHPEAELASVARTLASGRAHFEHRAAVTADSPAKAAAGLRLISRGEASPSVWQSGVARSESQAPNGPELAARLYADGGNPLGQGFGESAKAARIALPTYPFQRLRFWLPGRVVVEARSPVRPEKAESSDRLKFSLMFFSATQDREEGDAYRLVVEAARFADRRGFQSVWVPERHFTAMGSLYPSPAVLHAALARETSRVRLMAGSVVAPLHHPIRIAEEWAMVDNLSGGRVGISFASGWNPDDFAFFPERYADRQARVAETVETVRRLWRGEAMEIVDGTGRPSKVRILPRPIQSELPVWITAAGNPRTFEKAGELGANLLTHLLDQDPDELAQKIALYRAARAAHGHDPAAGRVTVMVHTFLGADLAQTRERVREPFCNYLKASRGLLAGLATSRGRQVDPAALSSGDLDDLVRFLFERFYGTRALIGTPESCAGLIGQLEQAGVNEIASLLDFGQKTDEVLEGLPWLGQLKDRVELSTASSGPARPTVGQASVVVSRPEPDRAGGRGDWVYDFVWKPLAATPAPAGSGRTWMLLGGSDGVSGSLASALGAERCHRLADAGDGRVEIAGLESLREFIGAADGGPAGIVCLWALDTTASGGEELPVEAAGLLESVRGLVQALGAAPRPIPVWFVTRGGVCAGEFQEAPALAQAPLWGFARGLAQEQPELFGGLIDLDPARSAVEQIPALVAQLESAGEGQVALRVGGRLSQRLLPAPPADNAKPWIVRPDATYLITGGLGGIGLRVADWLASLGARHLLLAGRSAPSESAERSFKALRAKGVEVEVISVDLADHAALEASLKESRAGRPSIRGIAHAAGSWRDVPVRHMDAQALRSVLAAKVAGTWALERVLGESPLDFFISFSSLSSVLPAPGQANYAAANAFLDAHARWRRARGRPALSVNWGPWSDVGFGATERGKRAHERLESVGLRRMAPSEAMASLGMLGRDSGPQQAIMAVDWKLLARVDPSLARASILADVAGIHLAGTPAEEPKLRQRPAAERPQFVRTTVAAIAARVLGLAPESLRVHEPLQNLGLDSLMAVEIKNRIQAETGVDVPLGRLLEGASVESLAEQVLAGIPEERAAEVEEFLV